MRFIRKGGRVIPIRDGSGPSRSKQPERKTVHVSKKVGVVQRFAKGAGDLGTTGAAIGASMGAVLGHGARVKSAAALGAFGALYGGAIGGLTNAAFGARSVHNYNRRKAK